MAFWVLQGLQSLHFSGIGATLGVSRVHVGCSASTCALLEKAWIACARPLLEVDEERVLRCCQKRIMGKVKSKASKGLGRHFCKHQHRLKSRYMQQHQRMHPTVQGVDGACAILARARAGSLHLPLWSVTLVRRTPAMKDIGKKTATSPQPFATRLRRAAPENNRVPALESNRHWPNQDFATAANAKLHV